MKLAPHRIALGGLLALALSGCAAKPTSSQASGRPECVSLESYSGVIDQVMHVQPTWESAGSTTDGNQYQWIIEEAGGTHTLTATLTADGCVCATVASSRITPSYGNGDMVGSLAGAAVAPISELEYTSWLEPKLVLSCAIGTFLQRPYEAEKMMEDGTTWRLTCSRDSSSEALQTLYEVIVITPKCPAALN